MVIVLVVTFQVMNCLGWAVACSVALAVVYGLFEDTNGHPISTEVAALYNALARIAWGAAVCWVIFACATGYGGVSFYGDIRPVNDGSLCNIYGLRSSIHRA
ncbi:nose resistant to fluoxetine protein 6 [Elysia marginata]|uniref:Nose resistant to fluoxetine protein 6 n=1 Tax=Elysia marginata TaxID=1093978 RepID=A0AAV4GUT7_9GAST|nr:nose resistant to fluoxetine protein 6 [Elysia marginata]